jgi:hypothetical protein
LVLCFGQPVASTLAKLFHVVFRVLMALALGRFRWLDVSRADELERWLALQVGGVYRQSVPASLLKPPAATWEDGLARRRKALRKPEDPQTFFLDFLPSCRKNGV